MYLVASSTLHRELNFNNHGQEDASTPDGQKLLALCLFGSFVLGHFGEQSLLKLHLNSLYFTRKKEAKQCDIIRFVSMMSLCSTAAPKCRTGAASFPVVDIGTSCLEWDQFSQKILGC